MASRIAAAVFVPRQSSSRLGLAVWAIAAAISVGFAWLLAADPGYMTDLSRVREWLETWLAGRDPYAEFFDVDYPPNAFVLLAPLSWIDDATLPLAYPPVLVAVTAAGAWILSGWMASQFGVALTRTERAALVLIMLAGESMRTAIWRGQTSPFALLLGASALALKARRPAWSVAMLACCAFKPHIALGFGLAILVTHGWVVPVSAAGVAMLSSLLFSATAHVSPIDAWQGYIANLWQLYSGPERVRGLLSIRWILEDATGSFTLGTLAYLGMALGSAAFLAYAAAESHTRAQRAQVATAWLLWSLLFLPHQLYHAWMAAPALWLVMWPESGLVRRDRVRVWIVAAYVTFGVVDVPRLLRLMVDPNESWTVGWWSYALSPLRITAIFALLLVIIARRRAPATAPTIPAID